MWVFFHCNLSSTADGVIFQNCLTINNLDQVMNADFELGTLNLVYTQLVYTVRKFHHSLNFQIKITFSVNLIKV